VYVYVSVLLVVALTVRLGKFPGGSALVFRGMFFRVPDFGQSLFRLVDVVAHKGIVAENIANFLGAAINREATTQ